MKKNLGTFLTVTAGILWGFSGACGQYIFERFPIEPAHLTSLRMLSAGVILSFIGLATDRQSMIGIWQSKQTVIRLMCSRWRLDQAFPRDQKGSPRERRRKMATRLPNLKEVAAIVLVILGTFFIATHGDVSNMIINTKGLIWGLLAAVALALWESLEYILTAPAGKSP